MMHVCMDTYKLVELLSLGGLIPGSARREGRRGEEEPERVKQVRAVRRF